MTEPPPPPKDLLKSLSKDKNLGPTLVDKHGKSRKLKKDKKKKKIPLPVFLRKIMKKPH